MISMSQVGDSDVPFLATLMLLVVLLVVLLVLLLVVLLVLLGSLGSLGDPWGIPGGTVWVPWGTPEGKNFTSFFQRFLLKIDFTTFLLMIWRCHGAPEGPRGIL